jgi:hypothetical protein
MRHSYHDGLQSFGYVDAHMESLSDESLLGLERSRHGVCGRSLMMFVK